MKRILKPLRNFKKHFGNRVLGFGLFLAVSSFSQFDAWEYSSQIFINTSSTGANVTGNISNFPLLVRLREPAFDFSAASPTGADIRFSLSDQSTELGYEIERWDAANGQAEVWVLVPGISGNNNTQSIYMYYGNGAATSQSSAQDVFGGSSGFSHVWHLNENPAGGANAIRDRASTSHGTQMGNMTSAQSVDAVIGKGLNFDGTDDYIDLADIPWDFAGGLSMCGWINYNALQNWSRMMDCGVGEADNIFFIGNNGTGGGARFEIFNGTTASTLDASTYFTTGAWTYTCGVWNPNGTMQLYKDGVSAGSLTSGVSGLGAVNRTSCYIGRSNWASDALFNGTQDELSISNTPRSANWIKLSYETQRNGQATVTVTPGVRSNQEPTDIILSSNTVKEGFDIGTAVGSFSTEDPDDGDSHTYALVQGTGDFDNESFSLNGSTLLTNEIFNFNIKQSYSIRVRTTDDGGLSYTKVFTITIEDVIDPPTALIYSQGAVVSYQEGTAIIPNTLSYQGDPGTVAVAPALPPGLAIDPSTGTISGTPTTAQAATNYTVTVTNGDGGITEGGQGSIVLTITINVASGIPTNITYSQQNPIQYFIGEAITPNNLSFVGGAATGLSIAPELPAGLIFNPADGQITGVPTVLSPLADYVVTVTNAFGSGTYTLQIEVVAAPEIPTNIRYTSGDSITYMEDVEISGDVLSYSGAPITGVSIVPDLPAGLSMDPLTGTISGTPTEVSASTDYTLTLTNPAGIGNKVINLTVVPFDSTQPEVDSITTSAAPGVYNLGDTIPLTLHFSNKSSLTGGNLKVYLNASPNLSHFAEVAPFINQDSVNFQYVVKLGDNVNSLSVTEMVLDSGARLKDYVYRNLDLSVNLGKNLPLRSIGLSAIRSGLQVSQISQGGGDTLAVLTGVLMIVPENPAVVATEIFVHSENTISAPGNVMGIPATFSNDEGEAITWPDTVEIRFKISTGSASPEDWQNVQVYLQPTTPDGKWTRIPSELIGDQIILRTDYLGSYIIAWDKTPPILSMPDFSRDIPVNGAVGQPVSISFTADDGNVSNPDAQVRFSNGISGEIALPVAISGSVGTAVIPGEYVAGYGLWFIVDVSDGPNSVRSDTIDVVVPFPDNLASPYVILPGSYQLISLPMVQTNPTVQNLFEIYWGPTSPSVWRLFDYNGQAFVEMNTTSTVSPGKSYWVQSQGVNLQTSIPAVTSVTLPISKPYAIPAFTGWNCFSNPFLFNVYSGNVSGLNQGIQIYAKDPALGWVVGDSLVLTPWNGYIFKNPSLTQAGHLNSLLFPPVPIQGAPVAKKAGGGVSLGFVARSGDQLDGQLVAGFNHPGSILGQDRNDYEKPPMTLSGIQIQWKELGQGSKTGTFLTDVRGNIDEGNYWIMEVSSYSEEDIQLEISGLSNIPPDMGAWLLDRQQDKLYTLESGKAVLNLRGGKNAYELELVVGTENYLAKRKSLKALNFEFSLHKNYPNPFSGITHIPYILPTDASNGQGVSYELSLYDIKGNKIFNLEKGAKQPGAYITSWDGTHNKKNLPAGIYLLRLSIAGGSFKTLKMIKSL